MMHDVIVDGLEDYLAGRLHSGKQDRFTAHLAECPDCQIQVDALLEHSTMVRLLRAPEQSDPAPGFYARVMERIEAQATPSLWSVFLEPAFGGRFLTAALCLFVILAGAVWQAPNSVTLEESNPMTVLAAPEMMPANGEDVQRDRNTVFVNLATYGGGGDPVSLLPVSSD